MFVSAGDKERFASYATEILSGYDVVVNYYGADEEKSRKLKSSSSRFTSLNTTKFIALKSLYDELIRDRYEWVAVFDDDAKFLSGTMDELVDAGMKFGLDVVSGCHKGKVSHPAAHKKHWGEHSVRYVNFVEMNFPVFRNDALARYMDVYDGSLCGWGNDWWYCNVLGTRSRNNAGVVDGVMIENPEVNGQMESFMVWTDRLAQWDRTKALLGLEEWKVETLGFA